MSEEKVGCEVCKKEIPKSVALTVEGAEYIHYFCSRGCMEEFIDKNPHLEKDGD